MSSNKWHQLLTIGGEELEHHLWHTAIIAVAEVHVRHRAGQSIYFSDYFNEDESEEVHDLISGWFTDSQPRYHVIFDKARNPEYFSEGHMTWDDGMCLAGKSCGNVESVCWDLQQPPSDLPDPRDDVTESEVEDFYAEWRASFLTRILAEAKNLAIGPTPST